MGNSKYIFLVLKIFFCLITNSICLGDFTLRQCEPIKIEMCRNIGYNETSMPNLVGNELQSEAEYILQTYSPLIEYVCSSQLKSFLCGAYVPMCTPKVSLPIGPCKSLCESVRSRCYPVLQGFGYPWPPALDCSRFPKENNHETMCMEGPGEIQESSVDDIYPAHPISQTSFQTSTISNVFECPGYSKLYVKFQRSGRCAPLCEANILFGPNKKHVAELWIHTWTYAALGLALSTMISLIFNSTPKSKGQEHNQTQVLSSLVWSHTMVTIGWTIRFIAGRVASSCGFDSQLPNVSILLVDGLSNGPCAFTFILRYYFGMAACSWWSILCLGWHRDLRKVSPDELGHITPGTNVYPTKNAYNTTGKISRSNVHKIENNITSNNLAKFLAWGLPAFQTAAVIVSRLVDADELLGACYVGNHSEKGLQVLVAIPLFCYWIFGSMNLASGFLVYRRNTHILRNTNSTSLKLLLQTKCVISGVFLFTYCLPYALLLLAVFYEFANIDLWLNESPYNETPVWPFLTRPFMEITLGIICFVSILGPQISSMYRRKLSGTPIKLRKSNIQILQNLNGRNSNLSCHGSNNSCSTASYRIIRTPQLLTTHTEKKISYKISMNQMPKYTTDRIILPQTHTHSHVLMKKLLQTGGNKTNLLHRCGDETIL